MANVKMCGTESNVHCNLSVKSSSVKKVVLMLYLLSLLFEFHAAQNCDIVKCITGVRSFTLDLNTQTFSCKKLSNITWCSEHCMRKYFPNAFSHQKEGQLNFTKFCEENISNRLNVNWPCIAKHIYRLFTCFVNVNSLTSNTVREDMAAESCRKYLEFPNCPKQILLSDCGKESSDVMKDLIFYVLDNYHPFSCKGANVKEVLTVPISYQLGNDFIDAAKSLDDNRIVVHNCLTQLIQDEVDLDGYLCGEYEPDIEDCVNFELSKKGKPHPGVKRFLFKTIALMGFKCKASNFEPIPVSTLRSSESEKIKPDDYYSLKHGGVSSSHEITTSGMIKNDTDDSKQISEFSTHPRTEIESKSEIPMKDSSNFNKNIKIINVSDSVNKHSKKDESQKVNSLNMSCRINLSILTVFFYCMFLLFVFR